MKVLRSGKIIIRFWLESPRKSQTKPSKNCPLDIKLEDFTKEEFNAIIKKKKKKNNKKTEKLLMSTKYP